MSFLNFGLGPALWPHFCPWPWKRSCFVTWYSWPTSATLSLTRFELKHWRGRIICWITKKQCCLSLDHLLSELRSGGSWFILSRELDGKWDFLTLMHSWGYVGRLLSITLVRLVPLMTVKMFKASQIHQKLTPNSNTNFSRSYSR